MFEKSHNSGFWPSVYEPLRDLGTRFARFFTPQSDASGDSEAYRISIELPGMAEEDVDLLVHGGTVTIRGDKVCERTESGDTWYFSERVYGRFSRSFRLPPDADEGRISASMKNGVLTVVMPRRPDRILESAHTIPIRRG